MLDRTQRRGGDAKAQLRCKTSEISVTLQRFGRNRVRVLWFEWLTRLPVCTALPVKSQRRDIMLLLT